MPRTTALLVLSVTLVCVTATSAQEPATTTVSGAVVDQAGGRVARAQLTLADGGQAPVWRATSDETGHYRFASIPAGRFSLDARLAGFAPSNQDVTVSEQPLALDVSLRIGGAMEVITVTATSGGGGGNPRRWRKQAWVATSGRLQKPGTSSCCIRKR